MFHRIDRQRCWAAVVILFCAGWMASGAYATPLDDGIAAYDRKEFAAALAILRPLAEQGNATAQLRVGMIHFNGRGVPQDYTAAMKWYRRASDQGNVEAQKNLGFMYTNGQGASRSFPDAYRWLNLAASRGHPTAGRTAELIEPRITAEQIAEAKGYAKEWMPAPELVAATPNAKPAPAAKAVPTKDKKVVADAQLHLARLGFNPGPADGVAGSRLRGAVEQYQRQQKLPVDGVLTEQLAARLRQQSPMTPAAGK